ncbi:MAG TPA: hypothetical protein VIX63_12560 [Vicinamibacterales bacterium]
MNTRPRTVLLIALAAASVVFCTVQDRVTADGARQYVEMQRAAAVGQSNPVTLDEIMRPAVRRSIEQAAAWSLGVLLTGIVWAGVLRRRRGGDT